MLEMIQALDEAALLWIQEWLRCPVLDTFFSAFTQLGNAGLVWLVVSGGMLLFPKARRAGFWALVAMLGGARAALAGGRGAHTSGSGA